MSEGSEDVALEAEVVCSVRMVVLCAMQELRGVSGLWREERRGVKGGLGLGLERRTRGVVLLLMRSPWWTVVAP